GMPPAILCDLSASRNIFGKYGSAEIRSQQFLFGMPEGFQELGVCKRYTSAAVDANQVIGLGVKIGRQVFLLLEQAIPGILQFPEVPSVGSEQRRKHEHSQQHQRH